MRTMSPVGPELKKLEKAPNVCRRGQTGLVSRGPRPPILDPKRSSGLGAPPSVKQSADRAMKAWYDLRWMA
jgi:hypothetical protein